MPELSSEAIRRQIAAAWWMIRNDPSKIVPLNFATIRTTFDIDENGVPVGGVDFGDANLGDDSPPSGVSSLRPYSPSRNQRRFRDYRDICKKHRKPVRGIVLKSRFIGATLDIEVDFACRLASASSVRALAVSHKPASAQSIYEVQKCVLNNLPDWMRPEFTRDSKELTELENRSLGIRDSGSICIPATNIETVHGMRFLLIHLSEAARMEKNEAVEAALSAALMISPQAQEWIESTGYGTDPFFHPNFIDAYARQGRKNWWERGFKPWRGQRTAFFFPAYKEVWKRLTLPPGVKPDDLIAVMDEDEAEIYKLCLQFYLSEMGFADSAAKQAAVEHLNWRRAKLPTIYTDWHAGTSTSFQLSSLALYHQQEPNTVEEAFETTAGQMVFGPADIRFAEECARPHLFSGEPTPEGIVESRSASFARIWKPPDKCREVWATADFAGGEADVSKAMSNFEPNWKLDFHYGFFVDVLEDGTVEQVGEYCSQVPAHIASSHMFWMLRHFKNPKAASERSAWPLFSFEAQYGRHMAFELQDKGYPMERVFARRDDLRPGRQPVETLGFFKSKGTTISGVQHLQGLVGTRRLAIRSGRLVEQMRNYMDKGGGKYEAVAKGRGGISSKDDGVSCMMQFAYVRNVTPKPPFATFTSGSAESAGARPWRPEPGEYGSNNPLEFLKLLRAASALGIDNPDALPQNPKSRMGAPERDPRRTTLC